MSPPYEETKHVTLRIAVKQVGGNPTKATPQKYGVLENTEGTT
jgi:hypothetical protein